jgi:hypothetical protein
MLAVERPADASNKSALVIDAALEANAERLAKALVSEAHGGESSGVAHLL